MRVFSRRVVRRPSQRELTSHLNIWTRSCSYVHNISCASHSHSRGPCRSSGDIASAKNYSKNHSPAASQPEEPRASEPSFRRSGGMSSLRNLNRNANKSTRETSSQNYPAEVKSSRAPSGRRILGHDHNSPIRARFAPSPTGDLHLGSLRTALFNKLVASATTGGKFILRIEDTDQRRKVPGAEERLMADLQWAGLRWQEGPDVGGPYGPYRQSERLEVYREHADQLLNKGHAYRCFCTAEQLEKTKLKQHSSGQATNYPGTCRSVPTEEADRRAAQGEDHVVRFKADGFPRPTFIDLIYGRYKKNEDENDFILMKQDGFPTYHLANVVDDHLMKITHVFRGEEWLISTPKHIALYEAFGWTPPRFAHLGLLVNPDATKLSKRDGSASLEQYRRERYPPMAMNTWLATLGSSIKAKAPAPRSIQELSEILTFKFTRGGIRLDPAKLDFFRSSYYKRLANMIKEPESEEEQNKSQETAVGRGRQHNDGSISAPQHANLHDPDTALQEDQLTTHERYLINTHAYRRILRFLETVDQTPGLEPVPLFADWVNPATRLEKDCDSLPSSLTVSLSLILKRYPDFAFADVRALLSDLHFLFFRPAESMYETSLQQWLSEAADDAPHTLENTQKLLDLLLTVSSTRSLEDVRAEVAALNVPASTFYELSRLVICGKAEDATPPLIWTVEVLGQEEMRWRTERVRRLMRLTGAT